MNSNLEKLKTYINQNIDVNFSLVFSKKRIVTYKNLQHVVSLKHSDKNLNSLMSLMCSFASNAEKSCAFAGEEFLSLLCNRKSKIKEIYDIDDFAAFLNEKKLQSKNINIVKYIAEIATPDTKVFIKSSNNFSTFIEIFEGHKFNVKPLQLKLDFENINNPHVLCIDGYIESVSEIHFLLQEYSESKKHIILCARGFADDVLSTIFVNNKRGTLFCYPIVVPYDLENVNTLVDIAVVIGSDVVSTTKGDLIGISNKKYCKEVKKATIKHNELILHTGINVNNQIKSLLQKIEDRPNIEKLYSERMKSLASKQINIYIPNDVNFVSNSHELDLAIRCLIDTATGKNLKSIAKSYFDSFCEYIENIEMTCLHV